MLVHEDAAGPARERLAILRDTEDGFAIADADFRLRGGGDLLGTRQSGLPGFRVARPSGDERLFALARRDAAVLLARDPTLASPRGLAVRRLLRLMRRDDAALESLAAG
jgi:ATP-dependent DNA helicase RecG